VSTAEWTGVALSEVLDRAGLRPDACEIVFRGADGRPSALPGPHRFERSLPVADARDCEALLAYAMNGEPLPVEHGRPVRLIVPGWYAMASVKWLTEIEAVEQPFVGHFQTEKYVYERPVAGADGNGDDAAVEREPVTLQRVRALITEPADDEEIRGGELTVRGMAWSGAAPIARVEVSVGGGPWQQARLVGERHRHSWQWWELLTRVDGSGPTTVRARATDLAGRVQPDRPEWTRLGYGANGIQEVPIVVR
jgi:DMSO/TMAO reductase YedYZ molybdopterin-dependent catalytic subunit